MHEIEPSVAYIAGGSDEEIRRIYLGCRQCYADDEKMSDLLKKEYDKDDISKMEEFIVNIAKSGHLSPLEHAAMTFHVICSRACSHQFVRHRLASYSQQSQRYVKMNDIPVIVPKVIKNDPDYYRFFKLHVGESEAVYKAWTERGVSPEDARCILPNCTGTELVVSMNYRELLHFFEERCCNRAQDEIRHIATCMLSIEKFCHPILFKDAGPKCVRLGRCPEAKPCGKPWKKTDA